MKCFTLFKYTRDYLNQPLQAVLFYLYSIFTTFVEL